MTTTQDRVSYSYGFKVPGPEQYSSVNASVSLSTDVRDGETPDQAMERARAFVHAQAERDMPGVVQTPAPAAPKAPARSVENEAFDYNNPVHYRLACNVFDHEKITSEKARTYKLKYLLNGERVGDIGAIIRKDQEDFKNGASKPLTTVGRRDGTKSGWDGRWPRRGP